MKKMSKGLLMTALICGVVYWGGTPVHASELQEFTLDEYVVTAARTETKLVDTPANISVVTAEQIESRHYTNVAEVMRDVPGATIQDNGAGASLKTVYLNGDERVLVMVDGRRMNFEAGTGNGASGFDMNQLPDVSLIERIEVLKGAGGSLYGSDAVGGVINIITKKGIQNFGKVSTAFGTAGAEDLSAMYYAKTGKTGIGLSASHYEQDYYKYRDAKSDTTKRWPGSSDFKTDKVSIKVDQELTKDSMVSVGYDYSKFEGNNPYDITGDYPALNNRKTENIYAKYDWTVNDKDQGYLQIYHNKLNYNNYANLNEGFYEEETIGVDAQQSFNISENNKLVVGTSWREADVSASGPNSWSNNYDESIDNVALFINDTWNFAPSWSLSTGMRYDNHSEAGSDTTLSAGLNKKFNENSHAYIGWSEVFRAPNTDDLFYDSGSMFGNPNLKPETGDTWNIGYNTKVKDKTEIGINYFKSDLKDAIDWYTNDGWKTGYCVNVNKQKKSGIELSLKHELNNNLDLNASYTYVKVENDTGSGYLRDNNITPNIYRLGVHYHDGKWDSNVWLRYGSGADNAEHYSPAYKDDYGVCHEDYTYGKYADNNYLNVDMAITYKATKNLKIFAKGYNLLNEAYAESAGVRNGSYTYPAQSRHFLIGAEYSF